MLIGLLGDIHGNDLALEAVLASARQEGVDCLLVTGDLVGYYFAPRRVVEMLRPWKKWIVRGNHEDMLRLARDDPAMLEQLAGRHGSGLRVALESLDRSDLDALCNLPHPLELEVGSRQILLCHGSPWDNDAYVYPDASGMLLERCAESGHDAVVMGHTHYSMIRKIGATLLINPGSIGQPRDRQPGAAWAILNTETMEVALKRETYAIDLIVQQAQRRQPDIPYLANVLLRR